jgi:peptide deformylase
VALLDIHVLGSPILRQETEPVTQITPEIRRLVDDMFETMEVAKGVGLAAPQVGRRERLCVVDADDTRLVVINPEIVHHAGGLVRGEEGCLSIPEIYADVDRHARITVRAQAIDGQWYEIEDAANLLGRCLQHEIDHLHGRLFTDRLSLLKKRSAMKEWDQEKGRYPRNLRVLPVGDLPPEKSPATPDR